MNQKLARELHIQGDLTLDDDYQGRGMSKSTHALTGTFQDFMTALGSLTEELTTEALDCENTPEARAEFLKNMDELNLPSLGSICIDNMGKDEYVFY